MKEIRKVAILLVLNIFCYFGYSQTEELVQSVQYLKADSVYSLKQEESKILIKSNVPNANVYLNNILQGQAPLSLNNLSSGVYLVSVQKDGYITQEYYIRVQEGKSYTYYFELKKNVGYVDVRDAPIGSIIYVDYRKISDTSFEVEVGWHIIKVRAFGYEDFYSRIYVRRKSHNTVRVTLEKADFNITNFSVSKRRFNPLYDGAVSNCDFDIYVTANSQERGSFEIKDEFGNVVFSTTLGYFDTWLQKIKWSGTDNYGQLLPQGNYFATVSIDGISKSVVVAIDYSLVYQLINTNSLGTSIGTTSTAFVMPDSTVVFDFSVEPIFDLTSSFYGTPIDFGFVTSLTESAEFSGRIKFFAGMEDTPILINFATKFSKKINSFCGALGIKYGFCTDPIFAPYGYSYGSGLGFTGAIGIQGFDYYLGCASEYVIGSKTGNLSEGGNTWKNGIALLFQPNQNVSLKCWANLHSIFNYTDENVPDEKYSNWTKCMDSGIGLSFFVPRTFVIINTKLSHIFYFGENSYLSGSVGLSFMM